MLLVKVVKRSGERKTFLYLWTDILGTLSNIDFFNALYQFYLDFLKFCFQSVQNSELSFLCGYDVYIHFLPKICTLRMCSGSIFHCLVNNEYIIVGTMQLVIAAMFNAVYSKMRLSAKNKHTAIIMHGLPRLIHRLSVYWILD